MEIPDSAIVSMVLKCRGLVEKINDVHFGHLAKKIEQDKGCQIFIEPFKEKHPARRSCLVTCEPYIVHDSGNSFQEAEAVPFRQHYIFYRKTMNIDEDRFVVAHELGHCELHWPLGKSREKRLLQANIPGLDSIMYLVQFNEKEQRQANIFASILLSLEGLLPSFVQIPESFEISHRQKMEEILENFSL